MQQFEVRLFVKVIVVDFFKLILALGLKDRCMILDSVYELFELYGQVTKCTRWMPWQLEAMKDVGACDKARGVGKQALILSMSEWGNPPACGYLH